MKVETVADRLLLAIGRAHALEVALAEADRRNDVLQNELDKVKSELLQMEDAYRELQDEAARMTTYIERRRG